jgi:Trk-type K+ transport system membrane component
MMFIKILRGALIILGAGLIFVGLMPHLGMVSDWETVSDMTRLIASAFSGVGIGMGIVFIAWGSGLLEWIFDKIG